MRVWLHLQVDPGEQTIEALVEQKDGRIELDVCSIILKLDAIIDCQMSV